MIPLILKIMKQGVFKVEGNLIIDSINDIFFRCPYIFKNYVKETINTILNLLYCYGIESCVVHKIYVCFNSFIEKYHNEIEKRGSSYIFYLIEHLSNLKLKSFSNYTIDCSHKESASSELFVSVGDKGSDMCLRGIVTKFSKELVQPFLSLKVDELFKSSDWKHIALALDYFTILVYKYQMSVMDNPCDIFSKVTPYFSSENTKIIYSTIKLTEIICERIWGEGFPELPREAIPYIIESAANQSNLVLKKEALCLVQKIMLDFSIQNDEIKCTSVISLFMDVIEGISDNNDNSFISSITSLVLLNIKTIPKLIDDSADKNILGLIEKLLKTFSKLFFMVDIDYQLHEVIDCIIEVSSFYSTEKKENLTLLIVGFIDGFNELNNLSHDNLEIQPCLFSLVRFLAEYNSECLVSILPKIESSLTKFISTIWENFIMSNEEKFRSNSLPVPFGCRFCFKSDYDGGICSICMLVSLLVELFDKKFNSLVHTIFDIIIKILKNVKDEDVHVSIFKGIQKMFNSSILYGDSQSVITKWNESLKDSFLQIMNKCSSSHIFKMIKKFTKCITRPHFDGALNPDDIKNFGKVLERACSYIVNSMQNSDSSDELFDDEPGKVSRKSSFSIASDNYSMARTQLQMKKLRECVHDLLEDFGGILIDSITPLFKIVLDIKPDNDLELIYQFLLFIADHTLEYIDKKELDQSDLLEVSLEFSLVVLASPCICHLKDAVPITIKLMGMYPIAFNKSLQRLDSETKVKIGSVLLNRINNPPDLDSESS